MEIILAQNLVMEKMNLSEARVFHFVSEGLHLIGYPKDIEMHSYVGDGDTPCYYATYEKDYKGTMTKHIKSYRTIENGENSTKNTKVSHTVDLRHILTDSSHQVFLADDGLMGEFRL